MREIAGLETDSARPGRREGRTNSADKSGGIVIVGEFNKLRRSVKSRDHAITNISDQTQRLGRKARVPIGATEVSCRARRRAVNNMGVEKKRFL